MKNRNAKTIRDIVAKHVRPRSVIFSDMWRGYKVIKELNMRHIAINHGKNFVCPKTGAHTNTIEGTWACLKSIIRPRNRKKELINNYLLEFIWRRKHRDNLWQGLHDALCEIEYE